MRRDVVALGIAVLIGSVLAPGGGVLGAEKGSKPAAGKAPARSAKPGGESGRPRYAKELGLTPAQEKKANAIMDALAAKMKALGADKSLTNEQKREKSRPLFEQMRSQMDALLTPQQRQKVKAIEQRKAAEATRQHMAGLAKELGITKAQQERMAAIEISYGGRFKAIGEDKSLSEAQKRAKSKPLAQEMRKKMDAVLTPAQRKKVEAMRKQSGPGAPPPPKGR